MATMTAAEFMAALDGAKVVRYDENRQVLFAWFGGTGIHGYVPSAAGGNHWAEVLYWMTDSGSERDARESDIQHSITGHIAMSEEDFWSFA